MPRSLPHSGDPRDNSPALHSSRRQFLGASAAALVGGAAVADEAARDGIACLDYGRSFICGTASFNAVRFWVESRTTISDAASGDSVDYYQCGSCKSENTFAERDLFHADNYDFLPILGQGEWLIFRRPARISEDYKRIQKVEEVWGPPDLKLKFAPARELSTWEAIRDATAAGLPLVTRTELENTETGLKAIIECPTKTMNVSLDNRQYQVDTGPVAFPDLTQRYDPAIDCLSLAFVAFNAPHFADFVVEQPTPLLDGDVEVGSLYHYSAPFSLPARNSVLALDV